MVDITLGEKIVSMEVSQLADLMMAAIPSTVLTGEGLSGQAMLMRAGAKAMVPAMLAAFAPQAVAAGLPAPDMRSPACRANTIAYGVRYVVETIVAALESRRWVCEGGEVDGRYVVSRIYPAPPPAAIIDAEPVGASSTAE